MDGERRIWQQVTDIFVECSIDYNRDSPITHKFYAMVQNNFHYAITGQIAAEIIYTEDLIEQENAFAVERFTASVNKFLTFRRYDILLTRAGFPIRPLPKRQRRNMRHLTRPRPSPLTSIGKLSDCWRRRTRGSK